MLVELGLASAIATVASVTFRLAREKIRADRDKALAELALKGVKPADRGKVIESLAKTKQFSPTPLPWRNRSKDQSSS